VGNLIIAAVVVVAILCGVHSSATETYFGSHPVRVDTWSISTGSHAWPIWETRSYE
jgi:hypothetical protein